METHRLERRSFLAKLLALGASAAAVARPGVALSSDDTAKAQASGKGGSGMKTAYDPNASFELKVSEVELRRAPGGRMLMARIYQPQGAGPFRSEERRV